MPTIKKITAITCNATTNKTITIPDTTGHYIVLYFYPKDATPGCTIEGQDFRDNYQHFLTHNTLIYGASKDSLVSHEKFKAKQKFPFELISDENETLCKHFDVIQLKKFMGREYLGIVRSTFIIAPDGKVLNEWRNVKVKGHVDEVLSIVKALKQ